MLNASRSLVIFSAALLLAACGIDTTGISAESSKTAKGPSSSLVTVTEYADLQCPACRSAHQLLNEPLLQTYGSRILFEFKHFPLQAIHPHALEAAMAAECAADQGAFWEFIDITYANQESLNSAALRTWAADLSLDGDLFDRCVRSRIKKDVVMEEYAEGVAQGVNSTPTYLVNGVRVSSNTLETISAAIDDAFSRAATTPL